MLLRRSLAITAIAAITVTASAQRILPEIVEGRYTVTLEQIASGLSGPAIDGGPLQFAPTSLREFPDGSGRLAISTLGGVVRLLDANGDVLPTPFLDTTTGNPFADLSRPGNYGMVSVTFHPEFANAQSAGYRKVYTITTEVAGAGVPDFEPPQASNSHQDVLAEWTVSATDPDVVDPSSRRVLMRVRQPNRDHNLNDIAFGPDGYMYLALGDGGNVIAMSFNAQSTSNVFGKILRIDVDMRPGNTPSANGQYAIPIDNPFAQSTGNEVKEIFAFGLRNPFRLSFDRATGDLYTGDVGQRSIESLDRIEIGGNYGWNLKEGSFLYDPSTNFSGPINSVQPDLPGKDGLTLAQRLGLTDPIAEYDHVEGRSVTGGFVYRGGLAPALTGRHIFGDFSLGRYFSTSAPDGGAITFLRFDPSGDPAPIRAYSFAEDESGEIYILGGDAQGDGVILKVIAAIADPCPGDANGDNFVNFTDLNEVLSAFGQSGAPGFTGADLNGDGIVDFADLNAVLSAFGVDCG
jgi:hypothetical protein